MKVSLHPKGELNLSDNEDDKAYHETKSKFNLIKQITVNSNKTKNGKV